MALHRSKLGPVGGSGGGGNEDGGVVVDLDPLSAFALMGQRTEGTSASGGAGPESRVGSGSSGTTRGAGARREQQTSPPPASVQPPTGMGGWHSVELNLPAPSSRVRVFTFVSACSRTVMKLFVIRVCRNLLPHPPPPHPTAAAPWTGAFIVS